MLSLRRLCRYHQTGKRAHKKLLCAGAAETGTGASASTQHVPVLLHETLHAFSSLQISTYIDCTLGAGGHALAIAEQHPEVACLIGIDVDPTAHQVARQRIQAEAERKGFQFHPVQGNFAGLSELVAALPQPATARGVDAVLMDVGVSSMQLDTAERGFRWYKSQLQILLVAYTDLR